MSCRRVKSESASKVGEVSGFPFSQQTPANLKVGTRSLVDAGSESPIRRWQSTIRDWAGLDWTGLSGLDVHDSREATMPDGYLRLYKNDRKRRAKEGDKKMALAGSRSKVGR